MEYNKLDIVFQVIKLKNIKDKADVGISRQYHFPRVTVIVFSFSSFDGRKFGGVDTVFFDKSRQNSLIVENSDSNNNNYHNYLDNNGQIDDCIQEIMKQQIN